MRANLSKWQGLFDHAFTPKGTFRVEVLHPDTNQPKDFEISAAVLGRYFMEHCTNGVSRFQISIGGGQLETMIAFNEIPTTFAYYLENGSQVWSPLCYEQG